MFLRLAPRRAVRPSVTSARRAGWSSVRTDANRNRCQYLKPSTSLSLWVGPFRSGAGIYNPTP